MPSLTSGPWEFRKCQGRHGGGRGGPPPRYSVPAVGRILAVPSNGCRYHAPSLPIDFHWESSLVPASVLIGATVADVAAQLSSGKPTRLTVLLGTLRPGSGERPSARKMSGDCSGSTMTKQRLGKVMGRGTATPL